MTEQRHGLKGGQGLCGLITGATYPVRALALFWHQPRLRGYVIVPILVNLVVGVTLYAGLLYAGFELIDAILNNLSNWVSNLPNELSYLESQLPKSLPTLSIPNVPIPNVPVPNVPIPNVPVPSLSTSKLVGWTQSLPHLALPDWHITLPAWDFSLPNWPIHLPEWHITLPIGNWHLPDWIANTPKNLVQWLPSLSDLHFTLPDWVAAVPSWLGMGIIWLIHALLVVILLIVTGFILLQFGVLLGSPWYGKLSEELEKMQTGQVPVMETSFGGAVRDLWRAILYEVKKIVLAIAIGLPLLLLQLFPGLGTAIATIGGIALTATIVCLDFLDPALERRRLRFRDKLGIICGSLPASASFGLVCLGLVSIPFLNLLAIPVCVAAGTLFFCDRILPIDRILNK